MEYDFDKTAQAFRVWCEGCDFERVIDSEPPSHVVEYWGDREKARDDYSASSAAQGAADNHSMSAVESGHATHIDALDEVPK